MEFKNRCAVCDSKYTIPIKSVKGDLLNLRRSAYFCLSCHSLYRRSSYKIDDTGFSNDVTNWHVPLLDSNVIRCQTILKDLLTIHPKAKNLLDIGAGIGEMIIASKDFNLDSTGVECNPYAVKYAKDKYNIRLDCAFFNKDLYQKKFDIITCIHVMEHLDDPRTFFNETLTCLNTNGILYISVPLNEYARKWKELFRKKSFLSSDGHKIHFSSKGLLVLAKQFNAKQSFNLLRPEWGDWSGGFAFKFD